MELILIRHAESKYNTRESRHLDTALSDRGMRQREEVANYLAKKIDNIEGWLGLSSPFLRTLMTSDAIKQATGIPFKVNWKAREYGGPEYGKNVYKVPIRKEFPEYYQDVCDIDWFNARESREEMLYRLIYFLNELKKEDGKYVVVSHGMPILVMYNILNGTHTVPKWDGTILNTSVTYFVDNECVYYAKFVNSGTDPRTGKDPRSSLGF
jgi:broad specificity phosphatase PhoE